MVGVAQLVERQVVVLDVAGSSPVVHPIFITNFSRGVAQSGSALALGARGRQFESGRPDHFFTLARTCFNRKYP